MSSTETITGNGSGTGTGGQSSGSGSNLDAGSGIGSSSSGGWGSGTGTATGSDTESDTISSSGGGSSTGGGYVDSGGETDTPKITMLEPQSNYVMEAQTSSTTENSGNMSASDTTASSHTKKNEQRYVDPEQEEYRRVGQIPEEESQKKNSDDQNQLSDAQFSTTAAIKPRNRQDNSTKRSSPLYSSEKNRIYFPDTRFTRAGRSYPIASEKNEKEEDTRTRVKTWDPSGRKRRNTLKEQAQIVFYDMIGKGYSPDEIRKITLDNIRRNDRGEFNSRSKGSREKRRQAVRDQQYKALLKIIDNASNGNRAKTMSSIDMLENLGMVESAPQQSTTSTGRVLMSAGTIIGDGNETNEGEVESRTGRVLMSAGTVIGDGNEENKEEAAEEEIVEEEPTYERNVPDKVTPEEAAKRANDLQERDYEAIESNKEYFDMPLPIENCIWDAQEGRWYFSDEVDESLDIIGGLYGLDPHSREDFITISNLIRMSTGLGIDMKGNILGSKWYEFVMREENVKQACLLITASQKMHGHPFGLTPANATIMWGGSNRYPVGCIDMKMAEALRRNPNSCLHSMSAASLQIEAQKTWKDSVQPTLSEHCMRAGNDAMFEQWASIEHMIMAMCERSGMDSNNWNVSPYAERRLSSLAGANNGFADVVEDGDAVTVGVERMARGANNYKARQVELDGRPDAAKTADFIFSKGGSVIRGSRILLEIPLLVSAEVEHLINNTEVNAVNRLIYRSSKKNGEDFKPTKEMYKTAESNAFLESFAALTSLRDVGGWDAVEAFRASGLPATKASIQAWAAENSYSFEPKGKIGQGFSNIADALNKAFEMWMPGDFGFAKADARLFVNCLMAEQARRDGVNSKDMERLMKANPGQFVMDVLGTTVGKDAYVSTKALYAGRISPLPELLKSKLKKNGFTDFAVAMVMQSWYVQYGLKAFELWVPFSNTISLAVAKKMAERGVDGSIDWKENAVGGSSETFSKAIMYDCAKLGQNTMQTLFLAALIGLCGGLQPPEDDDGEVDMNKFYLPWEWTIKFPWMDQRIPVRQNWFLDDILQGSAIGAVALCFAKQAQTTPYPVDDPFAAAGRMWWNGVNDIMGNNQVFEVGSIIFDLFGCGMDIANYVTSEDKQLGDHISSLVDNVANATSPATWVGWVAKALNISTPMVMSDVYPLFWSDDSARNYFENVDGSKKTAAEAAWNKYAVNNPFIEWIGNLIKPGTFGRENSNYQYRSDPTADAYANNNSYEQYCEKWGLKDSDDAKGAYSEWLLDRIQEVGGAEKAQENGILVSYGDYKIVRDYLNDQVSSIFDKIAETNEDYFEGNLSKDDKYRINDHYYSMYYDLKDQLNSMEYNNLVYDKDIYIEVAGTYVKNPETGELYNYGDKKGENILFPFYSPQVKTPGEDYMAGHWGTEIGNDFQTNSYLDSSDSSPAMLTSGSRNLVVNEDNKSVKALMDETKSLTDKWDEAIAALKEQGKSTSGGTSYSGRSYSRSYGSGSGSSYNPKIYSNPASMHASKPATMYSKTPYSTSKRYLNPTVYTSGSRSPYSRREG